MGCPTRAILGGDLTFTIQSRGTDGAPIDATGNVAYKVYEEETGTEIKSGTMAKLDDADTTGFYSELLEVTTANGYELNKSYTIRLTATVSSVSVAKTFSFMIIGQATVAAVAATAGDGATLAELKAICEYNGWHDLTTTGLSQLTNFINNTIELLCMLAPWPEYHKTNGFQRFEAVVTSGVNDASASTTEFVTDLTNATDDTYNNRNLHITSGDLEGQWRRITDYVGASKTITVSPAFSAAPADDVTFAMYDNQAVLSETNIVRIGTIITPKQTTPLIEWTPDEWLNAIVVQNTTGPPTHYALSKYTSAGATKLDMHAYPKPSVAINLYYTYQTGPNTLSEDTDQTTWPSKRTYLIAEALRERLSAIDRDIGGVALHSIGFMDKINRAFNQSRPSFLPIQAKPMVGIGAGKWNMNDINRFNVVFE